MKEIDRGAIIADYAEGHPLASITAEYGVSRATIHRIARAAGLPHRKRGPAARPERKCVCGAPTTSKSGMCRLCSRAVARIDDPSTESDELAGGAWVMDYRRRVLVWRTEQAS